MATPWITLSADDLLTTMTGSEREDFGRADGTVSVDDRVPQILADVSSEIRDYIGSNEQTRTGLDRDPAKIPPSMRAQALALARYRLLLTVPGYNPGEGRKAEYDAAQAYFLNVARGVIRPTPSDDPVPNPVAVQSPGGAEVVSGGLPRRATGANMAGL